MAVGQVGAGCRAMYRTREPSSDGSTRRLCALLARVTTAAALACGSWTAGGCATTVAMQELEGSSPDQPHSTILYSGVRDATRRFPDYSVVGREILDGRVR